MGHRSLEEGIQAGETERHPYKLSESSIGSIGKGIDDRYEEEEISLGIFECIQGLISKRG